MDIEEELLRLMKRGMIEVKVGDVLSGDLFGEDKYIVKEVFDDGTFVAESVDYLVKKRTISRDKHELERRWKNEY